MHKVRRNIMNVTGMKNTNSPNQAEIFRDQARLWGRNQARESFAQSLNRLSADARGGAASQGRSETPVLTKEQLLMLKEKYDAENMDEKEYYDFLMDLIDMKVLSKKEVKEQFVRRTPFTSMIMPAYDYSYGTDSLFTGNYLMRLMSGTDYSEYVLDMIRQGQCQVNPSSSLEAVRMIYENDLRYNRKVQSILQQLKSDSSGTEDAVKSKEF